MTAAPGPQQPDEVSELAEAMAEIEAGQGIHFSSVQEALRWLAAPSAQPDPWCREESCEYRHWTSGAMPTHKRGSTCPTPAQPVRATGEGRR